MLGALRGGGGDVPTFELPRALALDPQADFSELELQLEQELCRGHADRAASAKNRSRNTDRADDVVAVIDTAVLFVADSGNRLVQALDRRGRLESAWRGLPEVWGLALDGGDAVVLAAKYAHRVLVCDRSGRLLRELGGPGSGVRLRHPAAVAVDQHGRVWVRDEVRVSLLR